MRKRFSKLPHFPDRQLLGDRLSASFLEHRRQSLQVFLQSVAHASALQCEELALFLGPPPSNADDAFSALSPGSPLCNDPPWAARGIPPPRVRGARPLPRAGPAHTATPSARLARPTAPPQSLPPRPPLPPCRLLRHASRRRWGLVMKMMMMRRRNRWTGCWRAAPAARQAARLPSACLRCIARVMAGLSASLLLQAIAPSLLLLGGGRPRQEPS